MKQLVTVDTQSGNKERQMLMLGWLPLYLVQDSAHGEVSHIQGGFPAHLETLSTLKDILKGVFMVIQILSG